MSVKKSNNPGTKYITKWLSILAVIMMIGGTFAFGFIAFIANIISGTEDYYDPIWMVAMLPLMALIATPIVLSINNQIKKHLDILSDGMKAVANGESDIYIPTADANAFASIYEDFNKMVSEIISIQNIRSELIDNFSHELKTPVASINGFANLLLDKDLSLEKKEKYVKLIIKESERLSSLTQNYLLLSKIEAQEIIFDKSLYDLGKQIKECAINYEFECSKKNIEISAQLIDFIYNGNQYLMESVWNNLLSNAIKFTPVNGKININMEILENVLKIDFQDSGIGMSDHDLAHMFDKFYQADNSHSLNGQGLGLSIVKRIINLCNGKIIVKSELGKGSTFTIFLPI